MKTKLPKCKFTAGAGGMWCPCCTKLPPRKLKKAIRKTARRYNKKEIKNGHVHQ